MWLMKDWRLIARLDYRLKTAFGHYKKFSTVFPLAKIWIYCSNSIFKLTIRTGANCWNKVSKTNFLYRNILKENGKKSHATFFHKNRTHRVLKNETGEQFLGHSQSTAKVIEREGHAHAEHSQRYAENRPFGLDPVVGSGLHQPQQAAQSDP